MESIAPISLAENWDNSGLQVGSRDQEVKSIRIALDPTPDVVDAVCQSNADMLITHHPLIFTPVKSIDVNSPIGYVIRRLIQHQVALYSAHTNLDAAIGGVNDVLANRIGLINIRWLLTSDQTDLYKLVIFVPSTHEKIVLDSLLNSKAGKIGTYASCSFRNSGKGTFRPDVGSNPYIGTIGEIEHVDEVRIETVVLKKDLPQVLKTVRQSHPYETMAYDVYPLANPGKYPGIGRIGDLPKPMDLKTLALQMKDQLRLNSIKIAGDFALEVKTAVVCAGSGSSLLKEFRSSGAQVYITGDMHYHHAREAESCGFGIIDIGHFASEHLIVNALSERLSVMISDAGFNVAVDAFQEEKDPFITLL